MPERRQIVTGMPGRDEKIPQTKFSVVQYVILAVFIFLAYGLWILQVRKTDEYVTRSEQNRIRQVPILAPRGKIYDRDGQLIVDNYPSFSALLLRDQMRDLNADAQKIADGLHIPAQDIIDKVRRYQLARKPAFEPIIIKDDITPDERAFIESHRDEFPELETLMIHRRLYPKDGFMAHLIGYVGEVSEDMLNSPKFELYERGDIVGQSGVELQYNDLLMGKDGSRRVLVNSKGKEVGRPPNANILAVPGQKLKLTVDLDIQKAAEQAMEGKNGAVVVFLSAQCPVVRGYHERINQIAADYQAKGINFIGINSNASESLEWVRSNAAEYGYKFPVLIDKGNVLADKLGASVTPEVYYLDAKNTLLYHGAIDNDRSGRNVSENYLKTAFDASLSGKKVERPTANAFGCSIKRVGDQ